MNNKRYLLFDPRPAPIGLPCQWVIVDGRVRDGATSDQKFLYGTVVMRGPDFSRGETEPIKEYDTGHSYLLGCPGTSWVNLSDIGAIL